jgi:hypothetical protein
MFDGVFKKIVEIAASANSEVTSRAVIESSGFSKAFGNLNDTRSGGREKFYSTDAVPGDVRDLARLLLIGQVLKPIVALEIGSGYSTAALAYVISQSECEFSGIDIPDRNERSFVVESIDESEDYIRVTRGRIPEHLSSKVRFHHSDVSLSVVHNRYATLFDKFPNCLPDFIYLDGPSQSAASNSLNGFSSKGSFRMPMSADILLIEHFLEPGCVILIDGRTANARYLLSNFQRSWLYNHDEEGDVHLLMMNESPLGNVNRQKLLARGLL